MQLIKRSLVLIKAKQPFINWVNRKPFSIPLTPADVNQDCLAVLVPDFDTPAELLAYLAPLKEQWFEMELATWNADRLTWPTSRTAELFDGWFELEIHSMVWDTDPTPIQVESSPWLAELPPHG
jgi:hypothetical protein